MQKVEIILDGPEEEQCADLINDLARSAMGHFNVAPVKVYCGRAPVKKGFGELLVPEFMQCRTGAGRNKPHQRRKEGTVK